MLNRSKALERTKTNPNRKTITYKCDYFECSFKVKKEGAVCNEIIFLKNAENIQTYMKKNNEKKIFFGIQKVYWDRTNSITTARLLALRDNIAGKTYWKVDNKIKNYGNNLKTQQLIHYDPVRAKKWKMREINGVMTEFYAVYQYILIYHFKKIKKQKDAIFFTLIQHFVWYHGIWLFCHWIF